jgi:D-alanine-D-alanine ligase
MRVFPDLVFPLEAREREPGGKIMKPHRRALVPKGKVPAWGWWLTGAMIVAPLLLLAAKLSGGPAGEWLARTVSLQSVADNLKLRMGYVLFLPLGSVVIVLVRLTLGIRLLGPFRSVLIAVAFQVTGILLGIIFLGLLAGLIVLIRPRLRKLRLPYFGRVSFILGTVAAMIVGMILIAHALGLRSIETIAYFPIVVLCLIGEAFARKLKTEGAASAFWRGGMTAMAAVIITLASRVPGFEGVMLAYPEILSLQLAAIVLISELLDLRLFERFNPTPLPARRRAKLVGRHRMEEDEADHVLAAHLATALPIGVADPITLDGNGVAHGATGDGLSSGLNGNGRLAGATVPTQMSRLNGSGGNNGHSAHLNGHHRRPRHPERAATPMSVAVVRNRTDRGIINVLGQPCPERYGRGTIQKALDALRLAGHNVKVLEADMRLLARLAEFAWCDPDSDDPPPIVLNLSYGIQGESRYTHVPGMLEMAGVPYTGAGPLGQAVSFDKVTAKILMEDAGVPTPAWRVLSEPTEDIGALRFPLIVKPRHESTSYGLRVVHTPAELSEAVQHVIDEYQQDALVEEFIAGREFAIGMLGNDPVECLPVVEFRFPGGRTRAVTFDDKYHRSSDEPVKVCPAPIDPKFRRHLKQISLDTFRACHCRDYARIDIRVDEAGAPYVLEINSMASLGFGGAYVLAADRAGYSFPALLNRILDVAQARYAGSSRSADRPTEAARLQRRRCREPIALPA